MSTPPEQVLRSEAQPTAWERLNLAQQEACRRILAALDAAAKQLMTQDTERPRSARRYDAASMVDSNRSSRIIFLSGVRGTGKTTVLTSLLDVSNKQEGFPGDVDISVLQKNVVWLETLDMELMPPSLNLLPAILARIESAVTRVERAGGASERSGQSRENRGLLNPPPDNQSAILNLQRLQARIALSWQSNLQARSPYVDLDTFAAEVIRVESARLSLNQDLQLVLNHLAETVFRKSYVDPLFVLPVDDIDLSPASCLSLLQLLRSISVPRLFVLVLGDISVAEMIMQLQVARQFAEAAGPPPLAIKPVKAAEMEAVTQKLAANMLRKLIPPGQRIQLPRTDPWQSLQFRPLNGAEKPETLSTLLAGHPVLFAPELRSYERTVKNLRDLLFTRIERDRHHIPEVSAYAPNPGADSVNFYSAVAMLQASLRHLTDLWLALSQNYDAASSSETANIEMTESAKSNRWRQTAHILRNYVCDTVAEEESLETETRHDIISDISEDRWINGQSDQFLLDVNARMGVARTIEVILPLIPHGAVSSTPSTTLQAQMQFRQFQRWLFDQRTFMGTGLDEPLGRHEISPSLMGAMILFHDFVALGSVSTDYRSPLLPPNASSLTMAVTEWRVEGVNVGIQLPWPTPMFSSFWEIELFLRAWNETLSVNFRAVPSSSTPDTTSHRKELQAEFSSTALLVPLVIDWIWLACTLFSGRVTSRSRRVVDDFAPLNSTLIDGLIRVADEYGRHGQLVRDWLINLALLTMPETGIPQWVFEHLSNRLVHFWNQHRAVNEIRDRRYQRLNQIYAQAPELAEQLRTATMLPCFTADHIPPVLTVPSPSFS